MGRTEVDNSSKRGNGGLRFKTMKMCGRSESELKWLWKGFCSSWIRVLDVFWGKKPVGMKRLEE